MFIIKVLATLAYLGQNNFQVVTGDLLGMSQHASCDSLHSVSGALTRNLNRFIHFPNTEEERRNSVQSFYEVAGFPGVVGCIDCTHIGVKVPSELKVPSEEDKDEERDLRMKVLRAQLEAAESQIKSSEAIADACAWLKEAAQNVILRRPSGPEPDWRSRW